LVSPTLQLEGVDVTAPMKDMQHPALLTSAKEDGLGVGFSSARSIVQSHGGEPMIGGRAGGSAVSLGLRPS
jgi:hypothetical protein